MLITNSRLYYFAVHFYEMFIFITIETSFLDQFKKCKTKIDNEFYFITKGLVLF